MNETKYRRVLDQITPTPALLERTKRAMGGESLPSRPTGRRWLGRVAIACAVLCALTIGALAAVAVKRQVNPADVHLIRGTSAENTTPVGVSSSSLGWTVTVDEVYGDQWYAELLCTLSRDDGKRITQGDFGFSNWDLGITEHNWSASIHWFTGENLSDNEVRFGFSVSNNREWELAGRTLRLELKGLNSASFDESLKLLLFGGGVWTMEVPLNYIPAEVTEYTPMLPLVIDGRQGVLEKLQFSPLTVWGEASSMEGAFDVCNGTLGSYDPSSSMACLILTDGTRINDSSGGGSGDGNWIGFEFYLGEHGPIRPEEVCGIVIAQTEYPLTLEDPS